MDHLKPLFAKYMNDSCTTAEIKLLMQAFAEAENEKELKEAITVYLQNEVVANETEEEQDQRMLRIYSQMKPQLFTAPEAEAVVRPIGNYFKYSIAAAFFVCILTILYFYIPPGDTGKVANTEGIQQNDINPGTNKAVLTLADGSQISLTDAENGELTKQAGITVVKTADGQIVYETVGAPSNQQSVYNTISTPAGGQYQINLPDGSKVWLNAASSLKYPTVFNGQSRKVELRGEAYFEVAKLKNEQPDGTEGNLPFIVVSRGQEVTVLGTHFNINSYTDEPVVKTTLLEGRVKVISAAVSKILKPGQQAAVAGNIVVTDVDATLATDWKNGNFTFNDESIHTIMRKLARWYDIDVVYKGNVPDIYFGAEISRAKKLSEVLKVLETAGKIHFTIEGRRVTVMQ